MAFRLEYVDHSWTKRQLEEECGERGLGNFPGYVDVSKEVLIRMLNHGVSIKVGPYVEEMIYEGGIPSFCSIDHFQ